MKKMAFKNPWGNGGNLYPKYISKTIDHWFNDKPSTNSDETNYTLESTGGVELTKADFQAALLKPTVEDRVRAIVAVFKEGDFVGPATIYELTRITKTAVAGEKPYCAGARDLISHINRITKTGDNFTVTKVDSADHMSKITLTVPVVGDVNLFIEIEDGATVEVEDEGDKLILIFNDVNGGVLSQYLTPELPNATLNDNMLTLLTLMIPLRPS